MKKSLFYIIAILSLSSLVMLVVHFATSHNEPNGFQRKIKELEVRRVSVLHLPQGLFYFAGIAQKELYLKNLDVATALYSIDFSLTTLRKIELKLGADVNVKNKTVTLGVTDTAIYVSGNQSGTLSIIPKKAGKINRFKNPKFWLDQTSLLSDSIMIGRGITLNGERLQMKLIRFNYIENRIEKVYPLKELTSGIFSTDGILQPDKNGSKLFYMYFYRGEFLGLDTNLCLLYRAKTIDTVTSTVAEVVKLNEGLEDKKETVLTQANPARVINRSFVIYKKQLYLVSTLKADNETSSDFRKNQIVDVYSAEDGKYLNSFYIPKYERKKLREFRIRDNIIFALFDDVLVKYQLAKP